MRRWRAWLLGAGALVACAAGVLLAVGTSGEEPPATPPSQIDTATGTGTVPQPDTSPTPIPTPTLTEPEPVPTPPPPPTVSFAWTKAGAFVWHETDIDPEQLGRFLRESGFGWVVVFLHDGLTEDPVEGDWVRRFRVVSGLPVGGWGVLRTQPAAEARLAHQLLARYGLDFYVANPEVEYEYSGMNGPDGERFARSATFVRAFRAVRPSPFPVGVSSYCRADRHDIDWGTWRDAGAAFLPQAYANDLGDEGTPAVCAAGARGSFPPSAVHPTVGVYPGQLQTLDTARYVELLDQANTLGFSVYLAETRMTEQDWRAFGAAITERRIAEAA